MTSAPLPNERHIDKSKLVDYLLHPVNSRGKLGLFSRYGFGQSNWQDLRDSLLEHGCIKVRDQVHCDRCLDHSK